MRLFELRNPEDIKDFKQKFDNEEKSEPIYTTPGAPLWVEDLDKKMEKHGFNMIGAGISGAVYRNPNYPLILKVFRKDSGYITWFNFCKANQHNKYVPKIRGSLVRINRVFWAARLELLQKAKISGMHEFIRTLRSLTDYPEYIDNNDHDPDLISIVRFLNEHSSWLDLHWGNVMARENGELVIIDPLHNYKDLAEPR